MVPIRKNPKTEILQIFLENERSLFPNSIPLSF